LEASEPRVRPVIEIDKGTGGDLGFAFAAVAREAEGDVGDLLGDDAGGAVYPGALFEGVGEGGAEGDVLADQPGFAVKGFLISDF